MIEGDNAISDGAMFTERLRNATSRGFNLSILSDCGLNYENSTKLKKLLDQITGKEVDVFQDLNMDDNINKIHLLSKKIKHRL